MLSSFANELTEDVYQGVNSHAVRKKLKGFLVKAAQRKHGDFAFNSFSQARFACSRRAGEIQYPYRRRSSPGLSMGRWEGIRR